MRIKWIKTNISPIQKICLTGLFIALAVICQKVMAVNYIPALPFVRVSFCGPALIIFASVLLGPFYGAIVGAASDLLGYLIFDPRTNPMFIQITAIYFVLGFVSYFVFSLVRSINNRKLMFGIEVGTLAAIWIAAFLFLLLNANVELVFKIVVPIVSALLFIGLILFSVLFKGKEENQLMSPLHICFASFICDFFILLLFGSFMKACAFGFGLFVTIFLCQAIVMFVNVVLDTFFITTFQKFTKKYFVEGK